jgi:hypothetical protein
VVPRIKLLVGSLAFVGASATAPIGLQVREHYPPELHRAAEQHAPASARAAEQADAPKRAAEQPAPVNPSVTTTDHQEERANQTGGREQDGSEAYFVVAGYRLKITDVAVATFTGLLVLVGAWQAIRLRQTMLATKAAADALPAVERAYLFVEADLKTIDRLTRAIAAAKTNKSETPPDARERVLGYQIVNHGKTPALVKAMEFVFCYSNVTQRTVIEPRTVSAGATVIRGGELHKSKSQLIGRFGNPELVGIAEGRMHLFFLGTIFYDDVFRQQRETRICWRYDPDTESFVEDGGKDDNRRT